MLYSYMLGDSNIYIENVDKEIVQSNFSSRMSVYYMKLLDKKSTAARQRLKKMLFSFIKIIADKEVNWEQTIYRRWQKGKEKHPIIFILIATVLTTLLAWMLNQCIIEGILNAL